jgi:hypothetical protein
MTKKAILYISIITLGILAYMAYGYLNQEKIDEQFRNDCSKNPRTNTPLTFVLNANEHVPKLNLSIKGHGEIVNKTILRNEATNDYEYKDGFSLGDTLEIIHKGKSYKIYGFQYHTVTVNIKKGQECKYKGAFMNQKWNERTVFNLD